MNKLKQSILSTAAMLGMAVSGEHPFTTVTSPERIYCKDCTHFPLCGGTFCKTARHQVSKFTIANNCKHFENPRDVNEW